MTTGMKTALRRMGYRPMAGVSAEAWGKPIANMLFLYRPADSTLMLAFPNANDAGISVWSADTVPSAVGLGQELSDLKLAEQCALALYRGGWAHPFDFETSEDAAERLLG
jgi:hypothetical protein